VFMSAGSLSEATRLVASHGIAQRWASLPDRHRNE